MLRTMLMMAAPAERARGGLPVASRLRPDRRTLLLSCGAIVLLWVAYEGLERRLFDRRAALPPGAQLVRVQRGDLLETVVATGAMEPRARIVIQSEIPGIVNVVHVHAGDRIARGQPLLELDRTRLEDEAAELRAALDAEKARARLDPIAHAVADLATARADHRRLVQLVAEQIISTQEVEHSAYKVRLAEIAVSDAHAESAARLAAVEKAESALRRVERDTEKSIIRSPIDGVILQLNAEVGTAVADLQNGGTVIATLADDGHIHLLGKVDENEIAAVRAGQHAQIHIDAFPGETFEGEVRKISASGASKGNVATFDVEVELQPDDRVRVGMSADARIVVRSHADLLLVPNTAVEQTEAGAMVQVADRAAGAVSARPIGILYSDGFKTAVQGGVAEGEWVVAGVSRDGGWSR